MQENGFSTQQTILVVDDIPENVALLDAVLSRDYRVLQAFNGEDALRLACSADVPDLILLDVMMPDMNGYDVCRRLKNSVLTKKIPVIFVTSKSEVKDETLGFAVGAVDYLTKPISTSVVLARVKTHLALYDQSRVLEQKVRERTKELAHTQDVMIHSLAVLAETRDNETGGHIMRTQEYMRCVATYLASQPDFRDVLDADYIDLLFKSAPLHDIGKVGVPDSILLKPGKLSAAEFEIMKQHTLYGRDAILKAEIALGGSSGASFLRLAREIAYTHHEKWDGSGYPQGLVGEEIPLPGRLMAIVDVYDALISKRVYKPPFPHQKAVAIITEGRGTHFDANMVAAFLFLEDDFRRIALTYADYEEERAALTR